MSEGKKLLSDEERSALQWGRIYSDSRELATLEYAFDTKRGKFCGVSDGVAGNEMINEEAFIMRALNL